jgi:hypothetical protein
MELKTLIRGGDVAKVEPGSQAEAELRELGFDDAEPKAKGAGKSKKDDAAATGEKTPEGDPGAQKPEGAGQPGAGAEAKPAAGAKASKGKGAKAGAKA